MILKEKPNMEIFHFFNKELFPLLQKYNKGLEEDYFEFKSIIDEPNIIKSRVYKQAWMNACKIFNIGISLCFDYILKLNNNNNDSNNKEEDKEYFEKNINIIFNFEKVICEYYQTYQKDKNELLYESKNNNDIFNDDKSIDLNDHDEISCKSLDIRKNMDDYEIFSEKNSNMNLQNIDFIFDNKIFFNNNKLNIEKNNNNKKQKDDENDNFKINKLNENNNIIIENYSKATTKKYKKETNQKKKKIKQYYLTK